MQPRRTENVVFVFEIMWAFLVLLGAAAVSAYPNNLAFDGYVMTQSLYLQTFFSIS